MTQLYYAMTMPGAETLAYSEIHTRVPEAELVKFARGVVLFRVQSAARELLKLRTVEDVYLTLAHITGLGRQGRDALRVLHSATIHADVATALDTWSRFRHSRPPATWRVVSQKEGTHEFRRMDAGQAVTDALKRTLPRHMRHVNDDADIEFWLWLHGSEALVGVRLSDAGMRHRHYKRAHLPASLRPTVAAAMSWLASPTDQDIVLDPLCGAGTLIIERALMAPWQRALGGDIQPSAVEHARRNANAASIIADWRVWDARSLPLDAASVTRVLTNLPFGKQIGTHEANVQLYAALAHEFQRVLSLDGSLVTLTSEDQLWDMTLRDHGWKVTKKVVIVILGQPASIFVARKA
jgi:tRNA (guanine6-N2)-methyltransferase